MARTVFFRYFALDTRFHTRLSQSVLGSQGSGGSQTGQRHLVRHRAPSARSIRNPVRSRVASAKYRNNGVRAESNAVCSRCRVRKEKIIRYVECSRCECKVKYGVPKERAVRSSRRDFADALYLSSAARRPVSSANLIDRSHMWSPYQSAAVGAVRKSSTEPSTECEEPKEKIVRGNSVNLSDSDHLNSAACRSVAEVMARGAATVFQSNEAVKP